MYQRALADRASARFPVFVSPPVSLHPLPDRNTVIIAVSKTHAGLLMRVKLRSAKEGKKEDGQKHIV